ncbi:MAG: hypothetical protein LBD99_04725 [Candidatus Margulisbacteria bacterium]|jgi:predicted DNA binding CopG/RHH family protein|nr:hypothetical protein [Candidatus Margulisiibacteriota bacterium]
MKKKINFKLDAYEQSVEDEIETYAPASEKTKERFQAVLKRARKNQSVNLRFNGGDLEQVKTRASQAGPPYQTFISMIIHKYITDQLWDKNEALKTLRIYKKRV